MLLGAFHRPSSSPEEKLRILVVEDDEQVRELLVSYLEKRGYGVQAAADGRAALAAVVNEPPDVALLDVGLPDIDGLELLKQLRTELPELVVLVISGKGTWEAVPRALEFGAADFISKPIRLRQLERVLLAKLSSGLK